MFQDYPKLRAAIVEYLEEHGFDTALAAMELAESYHTGHRLDGMREFEHQIGQALLASTLPDLRRPEETLATIFLHDTREDYGLSLDTVERRFGEIVADGVDAMSKTAPGEGHKTPEEYFGALAQSDVGSINKGTDRIHNQGTMFGAFALPRLVKYLDETETWILPMLREARCHFPDQSKSYGVLIGTLEMQLGIGRAIVAVAQGQPQPRLDARWLQLPMQHMDLPASPEAVAMKQVLRDAAPLAGEPLALWRARVEHRSLPALKAMRQAHPELRAMAEQAKHGLQMRLHMTGWLLKVQDNPASLSPTAPRKEKQRGPAGPL